MTSESLQSTFEGGKNKSGSCAGGEDSPSSSAPGPARPGARPFALGTPASLPRAWTKPGLSPGCDDRERQALAQSRPSVTTTLAHNEVQVHPSRRPGSVPRARRREAPGTVNRTACMLHSPALPSRAKATPPHPLTATTVCPAPTTRAEPPADLIVQVLIP